VARASFLACLFPFNCDSLSTIDNEVGDMRIKTRLILRNNTTEPLPVLMHPRIPGSDSEKHTYFYGGFVSTVESDSVRRKRRRMKKTDNENGQKGVTGME